MQEVEVKAALENREEVLKNLSDLGVEFGVSKTQDDTVYAIKTDTVEEFLSNDLFLRLRVVDNTKTIFTAKYHPERSAENDTSATEYEVEVDSRDTMEKIINLQGYSEAVRIRKTRQTAHYKEWEICLDEVEGLGTFMEVEHLVQEGADVTQVYEDLKVFICSLGVPESTITTSRYDIMLLKKNS